MNQKKRTTPGIRWSSPTQLLVRPSAACQVAERTGCRILCWVWSYVSISARVLVLNGVACLLALSLMSPRTCLKSMTHISEQERLSVYAPTVGTEVIQGGSRILVDALIKPEKELLRLLRGRQVEMHLSVIELLAEPRAVGAVLLLSPQDPVLAVAAFSKCNGRNLHKRGLPQVVEEETICSVTSPRILTQVG